MLDFLYKVFGKDPSASKNVAKERLRLVLVQDRASVSPQLLENLKEDLIAVITKYMDIDESALEVNFNNVDDQSVALFANIPVLGMKRSIKEEKIG